MPIRCAAVCCGNIPLVKFPSFIGQSREAELPGNQGVEHSVGYVRTVFFLCLLQSTLCEDPVYLQSSCALLHTIPDFVVFQEIFEGSKLYMRGTKYLFCFVSRYTLAIWSEAHFLPISHRSFSH